jgi:phosphoribosylformylglycinamidine synthase subunit PurQ / glutaminase
MKPKALILHATGTNRDHDAAQALELAGAEPEIVHLNQLRRGDRRWQDYQMLLLPGGFSYADALGAGKLLALDLKVFFAEEVRAFVESGKPVIGICNGFQALVKSGILPDPQVLQAKPAAWVSPLATLTFNAGGHFECRWVTLQPVSQKCLWTAGLSERIYCPIAHGEGNFIPRDAETASSLQVNDQIALTYVRADGQPSGGEYPHNPNGSVLDIAGVCNPRGNVLGLMPHPEDHIFANQHPRWTSGETAGSGLPLFVNGVRFVS